MKNYQLNLKKFSELSAEELYSILHLREEIFHFEQKITIPDIDYKDQNAIHIFYNEINIIDAYARIFLPNEKNNFLSFGRLAVKKDMRGIGLANKIVNEILVFHKKYYYDLPIVINAQYYLKSFYEKFNFIPSGPIFQAAGISHIKMILSYVNHRY